MARHIGITLFLLLFFSEVKACDACGCSISGQGIGLNAGFDHWQLGVSFSKPFIQKYSGREVIADERFSVELNCFSKKNN